MKATDKNSKTENWFCCTHCFSWLSHTNCKFSSQTWCLCCSKYREKLQIGLGSLPKLLSLCYGHTYTKRLRFIWYVHCAASIMGQSGTLGGYGNWADLVLGLGEKKAASRCLYVILYCICCQLFIWGILSASGLKKRAQRLESLRKQTRSFKSIQNNTALFFSIHFLHEFLCYIISNWLLQYSSFPGFSFLFTVYWT